MSLFVTRYAGTEPSSLGSVSSAWNLRVTQLQLWPRSRPNQPVCVSTGVWPGREEGLKKNFFNNLLQDITAARRVPRHA
ncbi:hypothetical protein [Mycobacterium avium]|uniref:hypothetical protein n=1 Tax=Mycobacterium avium TaxID=1764 RepID=UPI00111C6F25|nr:hypothetical protein [Mycobacterium avium]MBZ4632038.1 hypothetical protein [Mycobacterium avium subsp. hominissuis]QWY65264.1 hypothetical protein BJP78_26615 [Mycobacterium avium subsp. hominissuis]